MNSIPFSPNPGNMESTNRSLAQKRFNQRVKEKIYVLGMDEDDAVELAVEELVAQEVCIADIIPDVWVVKGKDPISTFCDKYHIIPLATTIGNGFNVNECLEKMKSATVVANTRLNYKLYAVDHKMDGIIISLAKMKNANEKIITVCLESLIQLYTGCSDLLKEEVVDWFLEIYAESNEIIKFQVLDLLKQGCTIHENNKRMLFSKMDLINTLKVIIDSGSKELLAPALGIIHNLSKKHEVRVDASEAHKRAVCLAEGVLCKLYDMIKHPTLQEMRALLLDTLASLTVNDHLALEVFCNDDEFSIVEDLLNGSDVGKDVTVSTMKFLVTLCGHHVAKSAMRPLIPLIINKICNFQECPRVLETAFLLMSSLAFKNKANAMALIECNGVNTVLQGMKEHKESTKVRRLGCLALQNMASSSRCLKSFNLLGVDEFITEIMAYDTTSTLAEVCKGVLASLQGQDEPEDRHGSEN